MQKIAYNFKYSTVDDSITFSLQLGESAIKLSMKTKDFLEFCDGLAISGRTFIDGVMDRQATGTGIGIGTGIGTGTGNDAEFNVSDWDKLMDSGG